MSRTRTTKQKNAPLAGRTKKPQNVAIQSKAALKMVDIRQRTEGKEHSEEKKKKNERHPCEQCPKDFSRHADLKRHRNSVHLHLRPFVCPYVDCRKAYGQKNSLDAHVASCHLMLSNNRCDIALDSGVPCPETFYDKSSLNRHKDERHGDSTHQCPYGACASDARKPKRVTRASEFRKHLLKKHGIEARDLTVYKVPRKPKADSGMPVAGPSGAEGNGPRKSSRPQSASTAPPAPPYSEAIHGGVPLIVTPSDDGQASTPGLSFGSPSPSPAPELCYERNAEMPGPSSAHGVLEACPEHELDLYGFPTNKDMSSFSIDATAGMNLMLTGSDLYDAPYDMDFNALACGSSSSSSNMLYHDNVRNVYVQSTTTYNPGFVQMPYPDTACEPGFFPPLELTGYEHFGQYSAWDMPVPEQTYVGQTGMILPPSLPQMPSSLFSGGSSYGSS